MKEESTGLTSYKVEDKIFVILDRYKDDLDDLLRDQDYETSILEIADTQYWDIENEIIDQISDDSVDISEESPRDIGVGDITFQFHVDWTDTELYILLIEQEFGQKPTGSIAVDVYYVIRFRIPYFERHRLFEMVKMIPFPQSLAEMEKYIGEYKVTDYELFEPKIDIFDI